MAAFLDNCKFTPTAGGTADWTYSAAATGYQSPSAAGVVNSQKYKYLAISADLTQWEIGEGAYNTTTGVLPRTTVLYNSSGTGTATGQSGAGAKISFTNPPVVAIVGVKEDLISIGEANSFSATQQLQAANNVLVPSAAGTQLLSAAQKEQVQKNIYVAPTRTILTSGSGSYLVPTGCTWIEVEMVGGGGGGGGASNPSAATSGGATTFGTGPLYSAGGGNGGNATNPGVIGAGGVIGGSSSFDWSSAGGAGQGGTFSVTSTVGGNGGMGGSSSHGGAGGSGYALAGGNAATNSGSGGGGGGCSASSSSATGAGGGAGATGKVMITSPAASYAYAVGAGGAGAAAGAGAGSTAGGSGAAGIIIIIEHYGS